MNAQIERVVETAEKYLGVKEFPPGSNNVIFNTAYYGREVSGAEYQWCCVFVWYVFMEAMLQGLFYGGKKTASCTELMNYAKRNGLFYESDFQRGDIALYNWDGGKSTAQHTGIITGVDASHVTAIEGNTSTGSDSNGGEVMRRTRYYSQIIGVYRPMYAKEIEDTGDGDMVKRYNTLAEIPEYARDTVSRLISIGAIKGSGKLAEDGTPADLDLSDDMLRILVISERAGAF